MYNANHPRPETETWSPSLPNAQPLGSVPSRAVNTPTSSTPAYRHQHTQAHQPQLHHHHSCPHQYGYPQHQFRSFPPPASVPRGPAPHQHPSAPMWPSPNMISVPPPSPQARRPFPSPFPPPATYSHPRPPPQAQALSPSFRPHDTSLQPRDRPLPAPAPPFGVHRQWAPPPSHCVERHVALKTEPVLLPPGSATFPQPFVHADASGAQQPLYPQTNNPAVLSLLTVFPHLPEDLIEKFAQMSPEQQTAARLVLQGQHVLIHGPGGTGKSFLIAWLRDALRVIGKRPAVTATTGVAAINIQGKTVHSWAAMRPGRFGGWDDEHFDHDGDLLGYDHDDASYELEPMDHCRSPPAALGPNPDVGDQSDESDDDATDENVRPLQNQKDGPNSVSTLIIDEVSMLSSHTFESLNKQIQKARNDKRFLGGLQAVFVGGMCARLFTSIETLVQSSCQLATNPYRLSAASSRH
ncbi:P-loop containing nucleoside triphosphate hydrolase protein [Catenaria anguillulae PL171]|uniref:p-loop containing nucleoside triphosphate hydrolase protein n=1 Tax=Catenaria anguillulae PL171 TaxID=765915 RepID=A0A1Y2HDA3_9FUNG|nr:P-loop containing nucleoside triphosphate hydrolase protein [Catenaria anguillulae PL171]